MILSIFKLLRTILAIIDFIIMTAVVYILSWLPHKFTFQYCMPIYRYWYWVFIRALGVNLKLHQKNHKPLPKQYILIGNHPSAFEDIGMPALFPARFLAKYEVKHWWVVGRISRGSGTLYFRRENKEARKKAFLDLLEALKQGDNVGLYPEGGCKGRRIHLPFRHGVFDLAIQSGVPILPVFLHYEAQEDFEWQNQHLLYKLWMIFRAQNRKANYYVYDALDPKEYDSKESFCKAVENKYLEWQKRYLD